MNFGQVWLHLQGLTSLWLMLTTLIAAWVGFKKGEEHKTQGLAILTWWLMPLPFAIWFLTLVLSGRGFPKGTESALTGWVAGWIALRFLITTDYRSALGLMAAWSLVGVNLLLIAQAEPFLPSKLRSFAWMERHAALIWMMVLTGVGAQLHPRLVFNLFEPLGVKIAFWGSILSLLVPFLPKVRSSGWALAFFSYLLGVSIVASRIAANPSIPTNLRQWFDKWVLALIMASFPVLFLAAPFGRPPDLAPAAVLLLTFVSTLATLGQWVAAFGLLLFGMGLAVLCWLVGFPQVLVERIQILLLPSEGESDQAMQSLWALARGGLFGRGVGQFCLNEAGCVAITLPITDGVWALISETTGFAGLLATIILAGLVGVWFYHEACVAKDLRQKSWFVGVLICWSLCHSWTLGWTCGWWPIMGLAAPLLTAGFFNSLFWTIVIAISFALSLSPLPPLFVPKHHSDLLKWLPLTILAMTALFVVGVLWKGVLRREDILTTTFQDRVTESICREAIWRGWIVAKRGGVCLDEEKLSSDLTDPRQRKRSHQKLMRQLQRGVFAIKNGHIELDSTRFRQSEPSGLGVALICLKGVKNFDATFQ